MANRADVYRADDIVTYDLDELREELDRKRHVEQLRREAQERQADVEGLGVLVQPIGTDAGELMYWRVFVENHRAARQRSLPYTQVGLVYPDQDSVRWLSGAAVRWVDNKPLEGELTTEEREKITQMALEKIANYDDYA